MRRKSFLRPGLSNPRSSVELQSSLLDGITDVGPLKVGLRMIVELRERQPKTARPKTVIGVVNPGSPGITLPSSRLNLSRDGMGLRQNCQALN